MDRDRGGWSGGPAEGRIGGLTEIGERRTAVATLRPVAAASTVVNSEVQPLKSIYHRCTMHAVQMGEKDESINQKQQTRVQKSYLRAITSYPDNTPRNPGYKVACLPH